MPWNFEGASCSGIDTEFFFPDSSGTTEENRQAKKICGGCYWKEECLTYALHYKVTGIWAATNTKDRDRLRKQLNIIAKPISNERYVS